MNSRNLTGIESPMYRVTPASSESAQSGLTAGHIQRHIHPRAWRWVMSLGVVLVLTGCGTNTGTPIPASPYPSPSPSPVPSATGAVRVTVRDADGRPVEGAIVRVRKYYWGSGPLLGEARADATGAAQFDTVPTGVSLVVEVGHLLWKMSGVPWYWNSLTPPQAGKTVSHEVVLRTPPAYALLAASIPAQGVSADRGEIELHMSIAGSDYFWGSRGGSSPPAPYLGLTLALPALDPASGHYTCYASAAGPCPFYDQVLWTDASPPYAATVTQFNFDPQHVPDGAAGQSTATLLLLDQSARIKVRNPPEHVATRRSAAQHFGWSVWRNLDGPLFHQVAVAGFAGPGGDPALPLRLPATPVWAPQGGPAFSAEAPVLESAIDTLVPLVGGSAPVFEALQAAISATASHVPASRRAVVAWLGGGDESGLSAQQQQQVLAALRQQQTDTGVQVMLIDNGNPDAAQLAAITELASALRAPRIRGEASGAAELAARLLSGGKVPVLNIVFRLQAPPGTFQAGTKLHGMLSAVDRYEGPIGGWAEIYLPFAAEIP